MNEQAYDINHLLESDADLIRTELPLPRMTSVPVKAPSASGGDDALISELAQFSSAHEELIQQYLRVTPVNA